MKRICVLILGSLMVVSPWFMVCFAQPIPSAELINNAKQYDGKAIVYQGEVIGDVMARGDFAWINVNDGNNAIGIWLDKNMVKDIAYTGSYKSKGDVVEVVGLFNRACSQHGGDLDIHAQTLRVVNPGRQIQEGLNTDKRNRAIIFLGVLILVWILSRLKTK